MNCIIRNFTPCPITIFVILDRVRLKKTQRNARSFANSANSLVSERIATPRNAPPFPVPTDNSHAHHSPASEQASKGGRRSFLSVLT